MMTNDSDSSACRPKFSKETGVAFSKTLRKRVNAYFKTNEISKNANNSMFTKTVLMLTLFFGPLILINLGLVTSPFWLFSLYIVTGLGMAGIGMGIMHDAIHGSYSKNQKVNRFMGLTFNLIGANATVWNIQHNQLHHTYTNIEHADDDINAPFFLRFSLTLKNTGLINFSISIFGFFMVWRLFPGLPQKTLFE
jgi:linoleoyl-CoA desaturase